MTKISIWCKVGNKRTNKEIIKVGEVQSKSVMISSEFRVKSSITYLQVCFPLDV